MILKAENIIGGCLLRILLGEETIGVSILNSREAADFATALITRASFSKVDEVALVWRATSEQGMLIVQTATVDVPVVNLVQLGNHLRLQSGGVFSFGAECS